MSTEKETFNSNILPDITPFTVDWEHVGKATHTSKNGGVYTTYLLPCKNDGLQAPILVDLFKRDFDRLRILYLSGIRTYAATWGMAATEGGRAPMILSGANLKNNGAGTS